MSRIRKVERTIKPFTPAALHDPSRRHLAFTFRIVGDSLQYLPDSVSLRPGLMPYHPVGAGDFTVSFLDSAGGKVDGYTMEDPRSRRSCDFSKGGHGSVTLRSSGLVEILAPADAAIASVVVSTASGRSQRFPPSGQIMLPPPIKLGIKPTIKLTH